MRSTRTQMSSQKLFILLSSTIQHYNSSARAPPPPVRPVIVIMCHKESFSTAPSGAIHPRVFRAFRHRSGEIPQSSSSGTLRIIIVPVTSWRGKAQLNLHQNLARNNKAGKWRSSKRHDYEEVEAFNALKFPPPQIPQSPMCVQFFCSTNQN